MRANWSVHGVLLIATAAFALAGCGGSRQANPVPLTPAGAGSRDRTDAAAGGMCSVYSGYGALSFCYDFDEASGTTLVDASGAGHNGTISSSGVTYGAAGLTTNSSAAETTDGATGSMTGGFTPTSGSFSLSFFVSLHANTNNYLRLAATGQPGHSSPATGLSLNVNAVSGNPVYAVLGYGSGNVSFGYIPLPLNAPSNVTLTYNATSNVATLCVGATSSPACSSKTLPAAYEASGSPIVIGGGKQYYPASATFDEAGYWQGTALTTAQIDTISGYAGAGAAPTPTPTPSPVPSATAAAGMCSIYAASGTPSFCYDFDEASGTTLLDASGSAHNGTISASGVTYDATGLTTNGAFAETTNGSTGSMTAGFTPSSGSFSLSFFVDLLANGNNYPRLVSTGQPAHTSPASGFFITANAISSNAIYADMGYGSGNVGFGYIPLALNTPANVTLTYNAASNVATLCVGTNATPKCVSQTLSAAYVPSANPIVFGGGSIYGPATATFDEAAYWQGTVLSTAQIDTISGYAGTPSSTPAPTATPTATPIPTATPFPTATPVPTPSPVPTATVSGTFNDWATYGYDAQRTDFNPNTTQISPATIANGGLHLAWQVSNNGGQTQPLIATNVAGHNALLITGNYYSINAYDAQTGTLVWGPVALQTQNLQNCGSSGVAGTPYYDKALGALFVAAGNGASPNHVILSELSVASGAILNQVDLTPTLLTGETTSAHTAVTFANGLLYVGTGSNCEAASWRGRVVAVNPSTMTVQNTFFTTYGVGGQDYGGGGVWAWGGVSSDASGNVYVATGNAETTNTTNSGTEAPPFVSTTDEQAGYAEHLVKITSDLSTVEDSDYPGFNFAVGDKDLDYTGTPVVFQPSGCNTMTATQGKGGTLVINDTTNLSTPTSYLLSEPSAGANYMGNPGYSPITGLVYAAVASGQDGSLEPPGMVAFQFSGCSSSILWHVAFGPDSFSYSGSRPRSAPTVTAGGVAFMGTVCTSDGNGGCTTPAASNGALWAVDASSGALLGGGNPILVTPKHIRMAPTVDGLWVYVFDTGGNLYGLTVDPSVKSISARMGHQAQEHARYPL